MKKILSVLISILMVAQFASFNANAQTTLLEYLRSDSIYKGDWAIGADLMNAAKKYQYNETAGYLDTTVGAGLDHSTMRFMPNGEKKIFAPSTNPYEISYDLQADRPPVGNNKNISALFAGIRIEEKYQLWANDAPGLWITANLTYLEVFVDGFFTGDASHHFIMNIPVDMRTFKNLKIADNGSDIKVYIENSLYLTITQNAGSITFTDEIDGTFTSTIAGSYAETGQVMLLNHSSNYQLDNLNIKSIGEGIDKTYDFTNNLPKEYNIAYHGPAAGDFIIPTGAIKSSGGSNFQTTFTKVLTAPYEVTFKATATVGNYQNQSYAVRARASGQLGDGARHGGVWITPAFSSAESIGICVNINYDDTCQNEIRVPGMDFTKETEYKFVDNGATISIFVKDNGSFVKIAEVVPEVDKTTVKALVAGSTVLYQGVDKGTEFVTVDGTYGLTTVLLSGDDFKYFAVGSVIGNKGEGWDFVAKQLEFADEIRPIFELASNTTVEADGQTMDSTSGSANAYTKDGVLPETYEMIFSAQQTDESRQFPKLLFGARTGTEAGWDGNGKGVWFTPAFGSDAFAIHLPVPVGAGRKTISITVPGFDFTGMKKYKIRDDGMTITYSFFKDGAFVPVAKVTPTENGTMVEALVAGSTLSEIANDFVHSETPIAGTSYEIPVKIINGGKFSVSSSSGGGKGKSKGFTINSISVPILPLKKLVDSVAHYQESNYSAETWQVFKQKFDAAKALVDAVSEDQGAINTATSDLSMATTQLEEVFGDIFDTSNFGYITIYENNFDTVTNTDIYKNFVGLLGTANYNMISNQKLHLSWENPPNGLGVAFKKPLLSAKYSFTVSGDSSDFNVIGLRNSFTDNYGGMFEPLDGDMLNANAQGISIRYRDRRYPNAMAITMLDNAADRTQPRPNYVIPYPAGVDFTQETPIDIYDIDDKILIFIKGKPFAAIEFSNFVDVVYTKGKVYDSHETQVGNEFTANFSRSSFLVLAERTGTTTVDNLVISSVSKSGNITTAELHKFQTASSSTVVGNLLADNKLSLNLTGYKNLNTATKAEVNKEIYKKLNALNVPLTVPMLQGIVDNAIASTPIKNEPGISSENRPSGSSKPPTTIVQPPPTEPPTTPEIEFSDLQSVSWAVEAIKALVKRGAVSGYPDGTFKPNENVTREEFVKILVLAFNINLEAESEDFTDVSFGKWYNRYISTAVKMGIVKGKDDGSFGVGENISRQDMAVMIARTVSAIGKNLELGDEVLFIDKDEIANYAKEAVQKLSNAGILTGVPGGKFVPKGNATRAQSAKAIYETLKILGI